MGHSAQHGGHFGFDLACGAFERVGYGNSTYDRECADGDCHGWAPSFWLAFSKQHLVHSPFSLLCLDIFGLYGIDIRLCHRVRV